MTDQQLLAMFYNFLSNGYKFNYVPAWETRLCQIIFCEHNRTDFNQADIAHAMDYLVDNPEEFIELEND